MRIRKNIAGLKINKILWIEETGIVTADGHRYWRGTCDCGTEVTSTTSNALRQKSCGCLYEQYKKSKDGVKYCPKCCKYLPHSEFSRNSRKWDGCSSECKLCGASSIRERRKKNPDRFKSYDLKKCFGITLDEKKIMAEAQDNKCASCKTDKPGGQYGVWDVDHCHKTGKIRALLCHDCNIALGILKDDPVRIRALADYIEFHNSLSELAAV